jgi:hypothetical protein
MKLYWKVRFWRTVCLILGHPVGKFIRVGDSLVCERCYKELEKIYVP